MSSQPEAPSPLASFEAWFARQSRVGAAVWVGSLLWLLAAWPVLIVRYLPHQDLIAHAAASYIADHISLFPEFAVAHGIRTNSALALWLSATAPWFGYLGAARVFVLALLAVNAFGYAFLLRSVGSPKRVWVGGLFAVPFVHNWYVTKGMLNFSLSFGLCLWILSQQKSLRERWSHLRAVIVVALCCVAWVGHNFPLLIMMLMAAGECAHAYFRDRANLAGTLRWAVTLVPAGALVGLGSLLAPVHEYARVPGYNQVSWENAGELILGAFRHFVVGPSFWSYAGLLSTSLLVIVSAVRWRKPAPVGFSGLALLLLTLGYAFVPITINPVWALVSARFVPFLWLALLVRVPERLPPKLLGLLACLGVATSVGSGAGLLRMCRDVEDFRSGLVHVEEGARVLPILFTVKSPGDHIEPLMHAWAHYTLERNTSADLLWTSRSVDTVHYRVAPPPRFHHDSIQNRARSMYSAEVWCGQIVRGANTVLDDCPKAWETEWRSYLADATKRYSYVLIWDAPAPAMALIAQYFPAAFTHGKLTIGKRRN